MPNENSPFSESAEQPAEIPELQDERFQFVLQQLLEAYQPILEEDLNRAKNPNKLKDEAAQSPPDCEQEMLLANRIFERFATEEVALKTLPAQALEVLGPAERWRWCLLHIRCCLIFGWLVCRGQRTFRRFAYYLYRYWRCVREVLGTPVADPPTDEQKKDYEILVQSLAEAYKPYLTDQLATVEYTSGLADDVISGRADCFEGEEQATAVFERLLKPQTAPALLGREVFEKHQNEPYFWFCRCWCLCAIRLGCCLARARNFIDLVYCLVHYFRCLQQCFEPIRCELVEPTGCVDEEFDPGVGGMAITIRGTATGSFFDRYTLEWRKVEGANCDDDSGFSSDGVFYPGGGTAGTAPVVGGGLLGAINTTTWDATSYEIRVCVYSIRPSAPRRCCCIQLNLFKRLVWIDHIAGHPVQTGPGLGPFNPDAPIVDDNPDGTVVPVGCCVTVAGSAFVGECSNRKIKCFDLRYGLGFLPGPDQPGFNPAAYFGSLLHHPVCYQPPDESQKRAPWNQVIGRNLTTRFVKTEIDFLGATIPVWKLRDFCFHSDQQLPLCPDVLHGCHSGRYTLLLDVEDTLGNHNYDTQHVWFDNKRMYYEVTGLQGVKGCEDLSLPKFVPPGAPCDTPWPLNLMGIVYDEYIEPANFAYPSDNFDYYRLRVTRQGGPTYQIPVTPSLAPPIFGPNPLHGNQRVGDPGTRCEEESECPPPPFPPKFSGVLSQLDLRIFDEVCETSLVAPFRPPPGFALKRGTCCGYAFQIYARDKTRSTAPTPCHGGYWSTAWAVCICNDIGVDVS